MNASRATSTPVLVTGAGGFIGRAFVRLLGERGIPYVGTVRNGASDSHVAVDLADPDPVCALLQKLQPQTIVNLAAVGVASPEAEDAERLQAVNVDLPLLLAESLGPDGRLLQAGSMFQYAASDEPLREEDAQAPGTPYAHAKLEAERQLQAAFGGDERVVCLRLFGTFGADEAPHRLLPSVARGCLAREAIPLSDGAQVRDWLSVEEVSDALLHLIQVDTLPETLNVGRGEGWSVRAFAERIAARLDGTELLQFGRVPRRAGEVDHWVADVRRLQETGWAPTVSLGAAIDAEVDRFRAAFAAR